MVHLSISEISGEALSEKVHWTQALPRGHFRRWERTVPGTSREVDGARHVLKMGEEVLHGECPGDVALMDKYRCEG
jgi:hypothetical protein